MKTLSLTDRAAFVAIGNLLPKLNSFILLILLARLLPKEIYGTYDQVVMISALAYAFLSAGHISDSLYFFLPQLDKDKQKVFLLQSIVILLLLGIIGGTSVRVLSNYLGEKFNNPNLPILISTYSTYIIFWIAKDFFPHFSIIEGKFKLSIIVNFLDSLTNVAFLLIPVVIDLGILKGLMAIAYLSAIKFFLYAAYALWMYYPVKIQLDKQLLIDQFKYCFPLSVSTWVEIIGNQFGKLVVSIMYPPTIVAIYAVGSLKIPIWQVLTKSSNAILRVNFAQLYANHQYKQIVEIWAQAIRKLSLITTPITFFLFIVADPLINILFTSKYQESIVIFKIFLMNYLLASISTSLIPVSTGNTKIITYGSLFTVIINMSLCIILVKILGYMGPAIATVLSFYTVSYYYLYTTAKILKINLKELLPSKILLKIILVNIICIVVCFPVRFLNINNYAIILVNLILFSATYFLLIRHFNLLTEEDKKTISKWLRLFALRK